MKRSVGVRCMQTLTLTSASGTVATMPADKRDWRLSPISKPLPQPSCECRRSTCQPGDAPSPPSDTRRSLFADFEPQPLVEVKMRDVVWSGRDDPSMYQQYRGQLNVAVYFKNNLLTIHVKEAKNLKSFRSEFCDAFVKVSLIPDEDLKFSCHSDPILDTNNPPIDEKFSFELMREDLKKRVYISVWNGDEFVSNPELLGSMSFGIEHIVHQRKNVEGWYFLLTEKLGKTKHLQAKCRPATQEQQTRVQQQQVHNAHHLTVVLKRQERGYGFSLGGWKPAKITKILPGGAASVCGLQTGDRIMMINGVEVTGSSTDSIARVIRCSESHLVMDVERHEVSHDDEVRSEGSGEGRLYRTCSEDSMISRLSQHDDDSDFEDEAYYSASSVESIPAALKKEPLTGGQGHLRKVNLGSRETVIW